MPDEVIQELWDVKDRSAKDARYDLDELCRRIQKRDGQTRAPVVDLSRQRRKPLAVAPR